MEHQGIKYTEGQFTRFFSPSEVESLDNETLLAYCWWIYDLSMYTRRLQQEADENAKKPGGEGPSSAGGAPAAST